MIAAAGAAGVPVPRSVALLGADDGLGAGFLMDRVDGRDDPPPHPPRRRVRGAPGRASPRRPATIAARIHAVDTRAAAAPAGHGRAPSRSTSNARYLDAFGEPHPALELGLRWLDEHAPAARAEPALVHGDFRNGNFIVGPDGIRAVLDWELAHLGDPVEDLGWLCVKSWRFGNADRIVGGFGSLDRPARRVLRRGRRRRDEDDGAVLGRARHGEVGRDLRRARRSLHLNGIVRSVELAALGRRVAEMEWDLLDLLDGGW